MEAEPALIRNLFPTIMAGNHKASKDKGGFTRVKKEARATLVTLSSMKVNVPGVDNERK